MLIDVLVLIACGVLGGVLAGLIGIGGGLVYILALDIFLAKIGVPTDEIHQFTIANSILAVFFASASSVFKLYKSGDFYPKQIFLVAIGSIISSVLVLRFFVNTTYYSKTTFGYVVLLILGYMLFRVFKKTTSDEKDLELEKAPKNMFVLGGIGGGVIASLSGMGGGVVMIPVFHTMIGIDIKTARSISLGVIAVTSFFMSINNLLEKGEAQIANQFQWGYIIPIITIPLVAGVLVGGPLGVGLSKKLSGKVISSIYAVFLFLFISKKILELVEWL